MSLGNFTLDLERFVTKANGNIDLVVRKISLDLFRRVIMKSPVDTGRFKSNWQVAIGEIPAGTLELSTDVTHSQDGQEHERRSSARSEAAGTASMSRATAAALKLQAGQIIYLVNNLSYASKLEFGHSKQAPAGMVRISVMEYPQVVQQAAGEVPK